MLIDAFTFSKLVVFLVDLINRLALLAAVHVRMLGEEQTISSMRKKQPAHIIENGSLFDLRS